MRSQVSMHSGLIQAWARRPLSLAALGLALGLCWGRATPGAWSSGALILGLAASLLALLIGLAQGREQGLGLALACAGLSLGLWRVQGLALDLAAAPQAPWAGLRLEGVLRSDEGPRPLGRHAWTLGASQLQSLASPVSAQATGLRLSMDEADSLGWLPGDRVRLYGTLRTLKQPSNPGEFDYRAYLLGRGLQGSFSARKGWPAQRLAEGPAWHPRRLAWQARDFLRRGLEAGLSERGAVLARGIVLGDRSGFERGDQSDFAKAGLSDILAVSGTHFTLALGLFLLLARALRLGRRSQAAVGLGLGLAYAMVTGFEAPVQRAFALFALWLLARLLDFECEALLSLAAGALLILGVQPGALWEPGFQLSFFCTWAVLGLSQPLSQALPKPLPAKLRLFLGGILAAQLALAPCLAHHFHQLNWPGLLSCWLSGLFTLAILGLGLPLGLLGAGLPGAALALGWPLERVLWLLDQGAGFLSGLPFAAWSTGPVPAWAHAGWALWPWAFLFYRGAWRRSLLALSAGLLAGATLWPGSAWAHRHPGLTKAWMLDVGQGDAILCEFEDGRTLLVDGGPPRPDAGAWVVVPALRALGIQRLDWVLATHADTDHVGGLAWILGQVPVGQFLYNGLPSPNKAWAEALAAAQAQGLVPRAMGTQHARSDTDGPWKVLHPSPPARRRPRRNSLSAKAGPKRVQANDHSVVLKVEDWLLLTGDLPKKEEKKLLRRGLGTVPVLKVGHHGSRGSTSPDWVRRLKPQEALISSGAGNSFGHPHPTALAALKRARLWRTDLQGCVYLEHGQDGSLRIRPWREAAEAALRQGARRPRSPWRALKAAQAQAWQRTDGAEEALEEAE